jgi:hypothetical protein
MGTAVCPPVSNITWVAVGVDVAVSVGVGVSVAVAVAVGVGVIVGVSVAVGVAVGVGVRVNVGGMTIPGTVGGGRGFSGVLGLLMINTIIPIKLTVRTTNTTVITSNNAEKRFCLIAFFD